MNKDPSGSNCQPSDNGGRDTLVADSTFDHNNNLVTQLICFC
jgi:hypothetical protein